MAKRHLKCWIGKRSETISVGEKGYQPFAEFFNSSLCDVLRVARISFKDLNGHKASNLRGPFLSHSLLNDHVTQNLELIGVVSRTLRL